MAGAAWTCETCGTELRGYWAHCGGTDEGDGCCLTFSGTQAFDWHLKSLVNGGCRPESELASLRNEKADHPRMMPRNENGVTVWSAWSDAPSTVGDNKNEEFKARMAQARASRNPTG